MIDQLTVADMDRFYATWKDGKKAGAKKLARLKSFIRFCIKRKWIAEDITEDLRPQEGSSVPCAKAPFTDDEMRRIYAACDSFGPPALQGLATETGAAKTSRTSFCFRFTRGFASPT